LRLLKAGLRKSSFHLVARIPGAPLQMPRYDRGFLACCLPESFRITSQPSDPRDASSSLCRFNGDIAVRLVAHMADRYRLPDALRRADTLAHTGPARSHHDRPSARLIYADARNAANEHILSAQRRYIFMRADLPLIASNLG
jgi:hypothetical protein